jgi:short-chain Z-isoprenyl diphosphate synthase
VSPARPRDRDPSVLTGVLYQIYEARLLRTLRDGPLPRHLGLILDGNRRYAQHAGLTARDGYLRGAGKVDEILEWCEALRIPQVTIWVLSMENLDRSPEELGSLLDVLVRKIRDLARHPATARTRRRIRAVGRLDALPRPLREAIADAERETAAHNGCCLNIAVGYSGRQEIADAVAALVRAQFRPGMTADELAARITPEEIGRHVYAEGDEDPDLIIRTSGEIRLSGFLLWQSVYSEYYFCDVYWPAFRRVDFLRALRSYQQRQRRFGR